MWLNEENARGNVDMQFGSEEFFEMVERRMQDPDNKVFKVEAEFNGVLGFGS